MNDPLNLAGTSASRDLLKVRNTYSFPFPPFNRSAFVSCPPPFFIGVKPPATADKLNTGNETGFTQSLRQCLPHHNCFQPDALNWIPAERVTLSGDRIVDCRVYIFKD